MKQLLNALTALVIRKNSMPVRVNLYSKVKTFLLFFAFASVMMLMTNVSKAQCTTCTLNYPDNSNPPRSLLVSGEPEILKAMSPGPGNCCVLPTKIKLWYSDEHQMAMGIRQVQVKKSSNNTVIYNYPISIYPGTPASVTSPLFGTLDATGTRSGNDNALAPALPHDGRPLRPALFITDITYNPTSRAGDWQQGGIPYIPTKVIGSWKSAWKFIDSTRNPVVVNVNLDVNKGAKNGWATIVAQGGEAPPAGTADDGYCTLVEWDVVSLGLQAGHVYRIQVMVHDGDQNKNGGDEGEMCTTVKMPPLVKPDINATFINLPVNGDTKWNDEVPAGTTYSAPVLVSKPANSNPVLTLNANGTYTFVADSVGKYEYTINVCSTCPVICQRSILTINVKCLNGCINPPTANTDIAVTKKNNWVILKTLANDSAGNAGGQLNPASVVVTVAAKHGTTSIFSASGNNKYTPDNNYVGNDTLTYTVCEVSSNLCTTALQIIRIVDSTSILDNDTDAADDFNKTTKNVPVGGIVKINDTDAQGDAQTVTAQNVTVAGGNLVLNPNGSYIYTPANNFTGWVNYPYVTTDSKGAVARATLYILVSAVAEVPDLTPRISLNPLSIIGPSTVEITVSLLELKNIVTNGSTITMYVDRPSMFSNFQFDPAQTVNQAGTPVQNSLFSVVEDVAGGTYNITTNIAFSGSTKRIAFRVTANPLGSRGSFPMNALIAYNNGGGEIFFPNNQDYIIFNFSPANQ